MSFDVERNLGHVDEHWKKINGNRKIQGALPARPPKKKRPELATMTRTAEDASWFVQDDLETTYYISEHPLEDERPACLRVDVEPPCSPKFVRPPSAPDAQIYISERGFREPEPMPTRSLARSQTACWLSQEHAAMRNMNKRLKEKGFTLPGQIGEPL
ncbi:unnamed protein product [Effrenium voratum]|uniref:Uncharacterized protein n=1 Tax=Effrenium voratum TaxID=2562239 RepID=A0AA36IDL3_9DINO|nr:unnamed protein product [Effrenium voratum]